MDFVVENIILDENNRPIISDNGLILCEVRGTYSFPNNCADVPKNVLFIDHQQGNTGLRYFPLNQIQQLQNELFNEEGSPAECCSQPSTSTSTSTSVTTDPGPSTSTIQPPTKITWPVNVTKLFLNLYIDYYPQVGPFKLLRNKKSMWSLISSKLKEHESFDCSWDQCESHFKSVMKSYNKSNKKNKTTGNVRQEIEWQEEIDKIRAIDDSVCPDILVGVGKVVHQKKNPDNNLKRKKTTNDQNDKCFKKVKREKETKENKYIEAIMKIAKLKEKGQNERLKKTLQVLREIKSGKPENDNQRKSSESSDSSNFS